MLLTSSVLVLFKKLLKGNFFLSSLVINCSPLVKTRRTFIASGLSPPSPVNSFVAALCKAISERVPHCFGPGTELTSFSKREEPVDRSMVVY